MWNNLSSTACIHAVNSWCKPLRTYVGGIIVAASLVSFSNCNYRRYLIARPVLNIEAGHEVSDAFVADLLADRRREMKRKFETEFQTSVTDEQFDLMVLQVLESYGRPLGLEFKQAESGSKIYSDGQTKPVEKFWYAAKTTKYENGYFLIVEVVADGS